MDIAALKAKNPDHWMKATAIRALALDAVKGANSGHTGMPIGMADVATVLFEKHLKFDAKNPTWPDRDRFILSAGHGSMLIYSLLYLCGDQQVTLDQIKNFRQMGSLTAGHPENFLLDAVETTTGPLGQGIANSVGFAIAEEIQRAQYGRKLVDHHTYVIAGDGCLMEGVSQEALGIAGRHSLGKLIVFWDNNNITIDGTVELSDKTNQVQRFKASGWHVQEIDGHDPEAIDAAIAAAKKSKKPSMIACKTHIALGHAAQDTSKGHGALTDDAQLLDAKAKYGWHYGPFEVPSDVKSPWEAWSASAASWKLTRTPAAYVRCAFTAKNAGSTSWNLAKPIAAKAREAHSLAVARVAVIGLATSINAQAGSAVGVHFAKVEISGLLGIQQKLNSSGVNITHRLCSTFTHLT